MFRIARDADRPVKFKVVAGRLLICIFGIIGSTLTWLTSGGVELRSILLAAAAGVLAVVVLEYVRNYELRGVTERIELDLLSTIKSEIDRKLNDSVRVSLLTLAGINSFSLIVSVEPNGRIVRPKAKYIPLRDSVSAAAMERDRPVIIAGPGAKLQTDFIDSADGSTVPPKAVIAIPVGSGGKMVGVISIDSSKMPDDNVLADVVSAFQSHSREIGKTASSVYRWEA